MLKVELTENYAGVTICGDYFDLDYLYDSFLHFIHNDSKNLEEELMQNHVYGFLYDVRHAYQGDRDVILIENCLSEHTKTRLGIKKKDITDNNAYFCFDYVLSDLLLDMVLMQYFMTQKNKTSDYYDPYANMVSFFHSCVLKALEPMLSVAQLKRVKKKVFDSTIIKGLFLPQWYEQIALTYLMMDKKTRKKEFMHIVDSILDFDQYEEFFELKEKIEAICREDNCTIAQIHFDKFPEEIEW